MGALRRTGREAAVLAAFLVLTAAMTWPWVAHLRDTSFDPGDSYLGSWVLAWDFHQTFRDPLHLFDANVFFPYRDTLAFSENQYGTALLFFPAFAAGLRPLTVHGLAMLFSFAFSGYGAFRLARTLTGSALAGWVAGIAFAFVPYRFHHLPHLPYVAAGWLALVAEAAVLFVRKRTWGTAAWLGAAWLMSGLTSIHWFLLGALPVALSALLLPRPRPTLREWGRAATALAAASLLLLPFYLPYLRVSRAYGTLRTYEETAAFSARLVDWITPDPNLKLWSGAGLGGVPRGELCLFPGTLLLVLGAAGAVLALRRRDAAGRAGLVFAVLGFLGSLGTRTPFHALLFHALPPFRAIRVPARWAMVADLGLAVLAGAAVLAAAEALARGPDRRRAAAGALACGLLLFEDRVAPLDLHRGEADPDALTRTLAATPMAGGLWQLPDHFGHTNARYVLRAADHWKPLVNGYSGFNTPLAEDLHGLLLANRPADLLAALERVPVSYVTIRRTSIPPSQRDPIEALAAEGVASGRWRFVRRFRPGDDLFAVVKTEPGAVSLEPLPPSRPAELLRAVAGPDDATLVGSVDAPAEDESVKGTLVVRGWARIPGEDLDVAVFVDGEARGGPVERSPRPDVEAALPSLGDCARAGWLVRVPMERDEAGRHEIVAVFRSHDGRVRRLAPRRFTFAP